MCIIIHKPSGVKLPDARILKTCFKENKDGAGFSFVNNAGEVEIRKGFMKYVDLKVALKQLGKELDITETDLVIHFRYATAGLTNEANCHPFPKTYVTDLLKSTKVTTDLAIAHNGVISWCHSHSSDLSDTMIFIKNVLAGIPDEILLTDEISDLIEHSTMYSKFAFQTPDRTYRIGNFIRDNDIYYSNHSYIPPKKAKSITKEEAKREFVKCFQSISFDDDFYREV